MDIDKILDGGYEIRNPRHNNKNKKGKAEPIFSKTLDSNLAHPFVRGAYDKQDESYIFKGDDYRKYINAGISLNTWEDPNSWDKQLAERQSAWSKLGNSVAQTAISEVVLGTLKGITDLFDIVSGAAFQSDNDYSNPASEYLAGLQEDFRNSHPIYVDPDVNISNGGLLDVGWWASNMPSVASNLTLLIPSTGVTKGLSWLGKALNVASKGKLGKFSKAAYRSMTGAGKVKSLEEARKLNGVSKWLNSSSGKTVMKNMVENGTNAAIMRTIENYQEAGQVYEDTKQQALDKFNTISDEEYNDLINKHADKLEGVDTSDKNAVAERIASLSADETFKMDYVNTLFDVIQLYSLRNPLKFAKSRIGTRAVNKAQRKSTEAIAEKLATTTEEGVEKTASKSVIKNFGRGAWDFIKDSARPIVTESTEGIEEAINYIAQEEGMHYGNTILGDDVNNGFTSRLESYFRSPELYDAAFWGVMGGIVFQGLGSGIKRLYTVAERKYENRKKKPDDVTGEAVNRESWQELFTTSETKRRVADINKRQEDYEILAGRMAQINDKDNPVDPFNVDENGDPVSLTTEEEKEIARNRAINDYIVGMTFRAMDAGNFRMLKAYLRNDNVRSALEQVMGLENDGGEFINSLISKMDDVADKYNENLIMLSGLTSAVNIKSSEDIPIEYLQIIARDNTAAQLRMEDIDKAISAYEVSSSNEKNKYGNKLDESLDYKGAVNLVTLTTKLAQLKTKKANIEKDKDKAGIGKQIELDEVNEQIRTIENLIINQEGISETDALSKLIYAHTESDILTGKNDEEKRRIRLDRTLNVAELNLENIIGDRVKDFKLTDENIIRVFGEDRASGSYGTLSSDINVAFDGTYGLNHIDKRLSEDYIYLSMYNMEKAILGESMVLNDSSLNKKVNELHNTMLESRTTAIDKAYSILRDTAKKYGFPTVSSNLASGQEIEWEDDKDKRDYESALQILNLSSKSNRQLYYDIQHAIMMDELIEASQNAANPTGSTNGESSSTSQNQNAAAQPQQTINQSQQNGQTPTGQGNTLNPAQSGQGQQGQGQNQNPTISDEEIITNMENADAFSTGANESEKSTEAKPSTNSSIPSNPIDSKVDKLFNILSQRGDAISHNVTEVTKRKVAEKLKKIDCTKEYDTIVNEIDKIFSDAGWAKYWNNRDALFDWKDLVVAIIRNSEPSTISSTGRKGANSPTRTVNDEGQPIPDAQREEVKKEISQTIMNAVKTAKQNGTDATEAINVTVNELNTKYGKDDEYRKEINRMAASWNNRAKRQGLAKDVVDLVILASSVTEQGGKYNFSEEFLKAAEKFAEDFLSAANAKEFNGKKVVSFESMLRFANAQMEDPTTAEYIYKSLKAWFESKTDRYIVLDNMDSTSILERAGKTDRELANERLGGTNVFRVQIDKFLARKDSKNAIDKIQRGDVLKAKVDNGDIILMVDDIEVGRLPQPEIDSSTGGFKKTNDGWVTDVRLANGQVFSELRKVWEDILLVQSPIHDKINSYIYQIIAANKINADTKPIRDAIEKDADLKNFFDQLKTRKLVDKKANNIELINGLVGVWNYIDLTNPDPNERSADINYSLDLWFNKLYDSYSAINNAIIVGVDNLQFTVDKITDGDVIQVAANDNNGYEKCTLGDEDKAFANIENTKLGVIKPGSVGVIQTTDNQAISQPNGSTGSVWAVLPNRSGIPGIVRGHALRFVDRDNAVNNTAAGRIRQAITKEFERRIREFVNDSLDSDTKFKELVQFIDLVLGNSSTNTPLLAPVKGGKFSVKKYGDERISISWQNNDGNFTNFTINFVNRQYNTEALGYKDIENIDSFIDDFKHNVLANAMFNIDFRYLDSDSGASNVNGLATRDADGNFVVTIPNGTDNPTVETFPSFKHFLMQSGAARWNTKNENGSNFTPRSNNQLRNQVLNVSIESKSTRPVEEIVDSSITPETINNGQAIDTLLEKRFGKDSPSVKRLQELGLIPSQITYTVESLDKGGHPSNIWTVLSKKKIYVNDEFIKIMEDDPDMAIRKLIHEQLHLKLHSRGGTLVQVRKRLKDVYDEFEKSLDNITDERREELKSKYKIDDADHIKEYLFKHINNENERLEEFIVESLTNRELASYLNSVETVVPNKKTKKTLLEDILEVLASIFGWGVETGKLYEKELKILQGYTAEEIKSSTETDAQTETLNTLNDYINASEQRIKFDKDTHTYYLDGEPADYSVTQYAGEVYGKPNIEGDYSHSSAIGTSMDAIYRDFFIYGDDVINRNYPNLNEARKKQILEDLHRLRSYLDNRFGKGTYRVITDEFPLAVMAKTEDGEKVIAGTMDMLIMDKDGNFHIFDFKAKNHPIDRKINGKEGDDRRNYSAQQNMYREMLETINPSFKGKVKSIQLIWMDTFYPSIRDVKYSTDDNGQVTVDGTPIQDYNGFGTPHLKENVEESIISLEISDKIEELEIPEMTSVLEVKENEEYNEEIPSEDEVEDDDSFDEKDYDGMAASVNEFSISPISKEMQEIKGQDEIRASSVQESTTPTLNQFVETLPLEERVEFNKLILDGTISIKCN